MNIGFQIDEISSLNFKTDSSLAIILESQKRNNKNFIFLPSSLTYKDNSVYASTQEIKFKDNKLLNYSVSKNRFINLASLDYVFVRQDPPYNMKYISSLHLLEQIVGKTKIINNPIGIRNAPEKISMLAFKNIIPPTIVTR